MSRWKAGDIVGLRVDLAESDAVSVVVSRAFGTTITTPVMNEYLEPLPRAMTDAEAALVDVALEYNDAPAYADIKLIKAALAVKAERAPPDSFEELKAIVRADSHPTTMFAAIARLEAKMKEQKQ